ncbi:P27 family phage terminase small subunit [Shewanella oncorhynchi]|uniref:P27 family phage terminase small subunit n=1 Tax=Shewanella oncorhynchi TaxID=2726434 RepID=A0AA50Q7H1_9GAMM|nr:P27 family phage terminase small subunit [Shewanella oncorhynchi]WMB74211.1 P27 family phage terminase small subunit [Shewanella oncorhynchi]
MMKFAIELTSRELEIFNHYKTIIEKEREVKPSENEVIAMLASCVAMYEVARKSIQEDGVLIRNENSYGISNKANPANTIAEKAQTTIKAYLGELLLTPKAKAQLSKAIMEKDSEDDPLAMALKKRAEKR